MFWRLTLREVDRELRAARARQKRQDDERAWLAWHVAALDRQKKLPRLEKLLHREQPRRQSIEEMKAAAMAWHRRVNGDDR